MADALTGRLVWDLPTRVFHWLLALSLCASYVTAQVGYDARQYHMWLGYWMIGLLTFRIVWGFIGTRHARFIDFFPTPVKLMSYLKDIVRGQSKETVGHNPLGSLMVFAFLFFIGLQAVSGLFMDDDIMYAGPFYDAVSDDVADTMSSLHRNVITLVLIMVAVHIVAVLYHVFARRERLISAMINGRKRAEIVSEEQSISGSRLGLAVVVAVITAGFTYWLVSLGN